MTDQEIYDQAVEAVARIIHSSESVLDWENEFPDFKEDIRLAARQILSLSGDWGRVAVVKDINDYGGGNAFMHITKRLGHVKEIKPKGKA